MNYLLLFILGLFSTVGIKVASGAELPPPGKWKVVEREYIPIIVVSTEVLRYRVCSAEDSKRKVKVFFDSTSVDLLAGTCVDGGGRRIRVTTEGRGSASGTYQNIN